MKYASACVLSAIALIIVVMAIVPSLANLVAGLGVEIRGRFSNFTESRFAHSYPVVLLLIGLSLLVPVVYALWRVVSR